MRIDFVFFDAGGGHRSAAESLREVIEREHHDWRVRFVHLQELLDPVDPLLKLTRLRMQDHYNAMLRTGWTLGAGAMLKVVHSIERTLRSSAVPLLEEFWKNDPPEMVLSLIPNFNRTVYTAARRAMPNAPYVTMLTDMADYPPHFWIERNQDQHFICGTARAAAQAAELGHPSDRIHRTSGMVIHPRFYESAEHDDADERRLLGLDPTKKTGLVLFGGHGSKKMLEIAQRVDATGLDVQMIYICGQNQQLERRLRNHAFRRKVFICGFTREIPRFMRSADFFIGKPGPGSISEALAMGLPVIVESSAWTLPQERYNAEWVKETGTGLVVSNFRQIAATVAELLRREDEFRRNTAAIANRAVFEVPAILSRIAMRARSWAVGGDSLKMSH
jgi:UDP:flavonoid glycosyltransferase YjiC (YdhE family)